MSFFREIYHSSTGNVCKRNNGRVHSITEQGIEVFRRLAQYHVISKHFNMFANNNNNNRTKSYCLLTYSIINVIVSGCQPFVWWRSWQKMISIYILSPGFIRDASTSFTASPVVHPRHRTAGTWRPMKSFCTGHSVCESPNQQGALFSNNRGETYAE